jgi:uncharacterized protein YbjT (DUF2867 family)
MRIVIAGGHGQIALRLERLLSGRGDKVAGYIRNPEQAADLRTAGADPVVCDLETATAEEAAAHLADADAAVFAAGAGPGSGVARKDTVDRAACGLFADAAELAGVRRFLVVSAMGAGRGEVTRDDVAAVLAALIDEPRTAGLTLELIGGNVPVTEAVASVARRA